MFANTESASSHEFVSQFGLYFFIREYRVARATVYLNEAATGH